MIADDRLLPKLAGALLVAAITATATPAIAASASAPACAAVGPVKTPAQRFDALFARVETEGVFTDSKTFADAVPRQSPAAIMAAYRAEKPVTRQALAAFVRAHFDLPAAPGTVAGLAPGLPLRAHIAALWPHLTRQPTPPRRYSSRLPFPYPYVVPGGRFREIYYWDSYFTLLGMADDGYRDVVRDMVDGFACLIRRYGHVPNGTRSYYLSRSQPPVFYLMVGLLDPNHPAVAYARYLPALEREYAYWMAGAERVTPGRAVRNVVRLPDGSLLNRYWDALATPRDESYRQDVVVASKSSRPAAQLYRDIRAAAESGWDFSSRWFADGRHLATIDTTAIVPVDLNGLLYGLERAIEAGCVADKDNACARQFARRAARRRAAIDRYLWRPSAGAYYDYDWRHQRSRKRLSAATLYPLFVGAATPQQAAAVADTVRAELLAPGGLLTTRVETGQQWDAPYGWAPLQWIAVRGLNVYHHPRLAAAIARRWIHTVRLVYRAHGKLVEKYDVEHPGPGGGGEYPLQDGFGWTNGVTAKLIDLGYDRVAQKPTR